MLLNKSQGLQCKTRPALFSRVSRSLPRRSVCIASSLTTTTLTSGTATNRLVEASSTALVRVANLASAWEKVSRRLPSEDGLLRSTSEAVDKIIKALRLSLIWLEGCDVPRRDGRQPFRRAVQLAVTLAELSAAGLPLDADSIAAGVLSEAADGRYLDYDTIRDKLGPSAASLVHDIMRVRTAPSRVELYEDVAASAIREWCIAFNDIRANVVEVVCRWDELKHMDTLPGYEQQLLALEALQVYAPLGHALGMGAVSAAMEDICFQVLFPESYAHTREWLRTVVDPAEQALYAGQQQLLKALDEHPEFNRLASGCVLRARTKSLFSMMKKLLRLGNMSKGGRRHDQIFDLLGMRAIVQPRMDLPPQQAEQAAEQACYIVAEVAGQLWKVVPSRTKDYISKPKSNGYRSMHLTVCLTSIMQRIEEEKRARCQPAECVPVRDTAPAYADHQAETACSGLHTSNTSTLETSDSDVDMQDTQSTGGPGSTRSRSSAMDSLDVCDVQFMADSSTTGINMPQAAPYLELQIRTQLMDDRAESGDAAHTAYKGGLDARQARQLQAWSSELQQRLAIKPQGKLLLPPSIVLKQEGMGAFDSLDLDGDWVVDLPQQSLPETSSSDNSATTQQPHIAIQDGGVLYPTGDALQTISADSTSSSSMSPEQSESLSPTSSTSSLLQGTLPSIDSFIVGSSDGEVRHISSPGSPAGQLFNFMDRNGDGKLSIDEIREQFQELIDAPLSPTAMYSDGMQPWPSSSRPQSQAAQPNDMVSSEQLAADVTSQASAVQEVEQRVTQETPGGDTQQQAVHDGRPRPDLTRLVQALASGNSTAEDLDMTLDDFTEFLKEARAFRRSAEAQRQRQQAASVQQPDSQQPYDWQNWEEQ